jgi:hypothetical protein
LIGTLLFSIHTDHSGEAPQVGRQWRSEPGDIVGYSGVVVRQRRQTIRNVMMIRAVEFVVDRTVRVVAPERP